MVWEKGEIQQELPTIGGDPDGFVFAINDNGQAIGITGDCASDLHAVLWNKGTPTDLGTLNGSMLFPSAINNKGQIVGFAVSPDGLRAFLWQNGAATDLGTLPPDVRYSSCLLSDPESRRSYRRNRRACRDQPKTEGRFA